MDSIYYTIHIMHIVILYTQSCTYIKRHLSAVGTAGLYRSPVAQRPGLVPREQKRHSGCVVGSRDERSSHD